MLYYASLLCVVSSYLDAIALTILPDHTTLFHLDKGNMYVRMLFIDYSSAFNTIFPYRLVSELVDQGLSTSLCKWIVRNITLSSIAVGEQV